MYNIIIQTVNLWLSIVGVIDRNIFLIDIMPQLIIILLFYKYNNL